jgi:hypothetical protein
VVKGAESSFDRRCSESIPKGRSLACMTIRWITAFIDRPVDPFEKAVEFWMEVTGSKLSETHGELEEFATLLPPGGDAYLRAQRVQSGGGAHVDLHVDDPEQLFGRAASVGARVERSPRGGAVVWSPGGMRCCVVDHKGESTRPAPVLTGSGASSLLDQVCVDSPAELFDQECRFWSALTGWVVQSSSWHPEFRFLIRPAWAPIRILLQRRDDNDGPTRAHLDIASDDVRSTVAEHVQLGAKVLNEYDHWTTMSDPTGFPYCLTARRPGTGLLATPVPGYGADTDPVEIDA